MPVAVTRTKTAARATAASVVPDHEDGGQTIARPAPMATRSDAVPTIA
jgi:hypothetical protein